MISHHLWSQIQILHKSGVASSHTVLTFAVISSHAVNLSVPCSPQAHSNLRTFALAVPSPWNTYLTASFVSVRPQDNIISVTFPSPPA